MVHTDILELAELDKNQCVPDKTAAASWARRAFAYLLQYSRRYLLDALYKFYLFFSSLKVDVKYENTQHKYSLKQLGPKW